MWRAQYQGPSVGCSRPAFMAGCCPASARSALLTPRQALLAAGCPWQRGIDPDDDRTTLAPVEQRAWPGLSGLHALEAPTPLAFEDIYCGYSRARGGTFKSSRWLPPARFNPTARVATSSPALVGSHAEARLHGLPWSPRCSHGSAGCRRGPRAVSRRDGLRPFRAFGALPRREGVARSPLTHRETQKPAAGRARRTRAPLESESVPISGEHTPTTWRATCRRRALALGLLIRGYYLARPAKP
jgi:hypothetical protein